MPKKTVLFPADFPKILLEPMRRRRRGGLSQKPINDPEWTAEIGRRVSLLCSHYAIPQPPADLAALCIRLMIDLIPGLSESQAKQRGPEQKDWAAAFKERLDLLAKYDASKQKNPALTDLQFCKSVASRSGIHKGYGPEKLRKLLRKAKSEREQRNNHAAIVADAIEPVIAVPRGKA